VYMEKRHEEGQFAVGPGRRRRGRLGVLDWRGGRAAARSARGLRTRCPHATPSVEANVAKSERS